MAERFAFEGFQLDGTTGTVTGPDGAVELQPLSYALLRHLLHHPGVLFSRRQLLNDVWPDTYVSDESLTKAISRLRSALGRKDLIETVPRRGYRLNAQVEQLQRAAPSLPDTVPTWDSRWFGRDALLAELVGRLDRGERLLTLKGPAGVGKTRLAARLCDATPSEVALRRLFVDLSAAGSATEVVQAVAAPLGVALGQGDAARRVGYALRGLGRALVVLDNFEQVAAHAAATVGWWLRDAPDAAFVVTSREVLGVRSERVIEVGPLGLDDGVALFSDRSGVRADAARVRGLVQALDGLPLALELAAARARELSLDTLVHRLQDRFTVLRAPGAVEPARHRSLEAALETSWSLLSPGEQAALASLTRFSSGFDAEGAAAVADLDDALDLLQVLADRSLLTVDRAAQRFSLPASIRDFARERAEAGSLAEAEARLARWLARLGEPEALDRAQRGDPDGHLHRLRTWRADLVAAGERALARGEPTLAEPLALAAWPVLRATGPFGRVAALLEALLDEAGLQRPFSVAHAAGQALELADRLDRAERAHTRALRLATEQGDPRLEAVAHLNLARVHHTLGLDEAAGRDGQQALAAARVARADRLEATALILMAQRARKRGRRAEFLEWVGPGLQALRRIDDPSLAPLIEANEALRLAASGDPAEAVSLLDRALRRTRGAGDRLREAEILNLLAQVADEHGTADEAATHHRRAAAAWQALGRPELEAQALAGLAAALDTLERTEEAAVARAEAQTLRQSIGIDAPTRG